MDPELAIPLLLLTAAAACWAGRWYERRRHRAAWAGALAAGRQDLRAYGELAARNRVLARKNEELAGELAAAACPNGYWRRMRERSL